MSKLKQFSLSKLTSQIEQSLSSSFQELQRRSTHSSSLSGELSSQWLSKCPTSEDFTFTPSQLKTLLAKRLPTPTHTYAPGSKCKCGKSLDDGGSHTPSSCSVDGSLHNIHNSVLRVTDQAARSHGLNSTLELTTLSPATGDLSEKRPGTTATSWPSEKSLRVTDLAVASPESKSTVYSSDPMSTDPLRLLKKKRAPKN